MSKYGEALRRIIEQSGISKNSLHNQGIINRNNLNLTISKIDSPGVEAIEKYLKAFGATWHDWARTLEEIEQELGKDEKHAPLPLKKPPAKKPAKHGPASHRPPSNW